MTLVGYKAKNHPQQVGRSGRDKAVDDRALPADDFSDLNRRFRFTVDVAASIWNKKCDKFYSEMNSGLLAAWSGDRVYCNPPYSDIRPWVEKAWEQTGTDITVMLLPANRTEQSWWQDLVEPWRDRKGPLRVEFMRGRLRFIRNGAKRVGPNERPPFGCCLLIWDWNRNV